MLLEIGVLFIIWCCALLCFSLARDFASKEPSIIEIMLAMISLIVGLIISWLAFTVAGLYAIITLAIILIVIFIVKTLSVPSSP